MKRLHPLLLIILAISCENSKSPSKGRETFELHSYVVTLTNDSMIFVRVEAQEESLGLVTLPAMQPGRGGAVTQGGTPERSATADAMRGGTPEGRLVPLRRSRAVGSGTGSSDEPVGNARNPVGSPKEPVGLPTLPRARFKRGELPLLINKDEAEDAAPLEAKGAPVLKARAEAEAFGTWLATKPPGDRSLFGRRLGRGTQGEVFAVSDAASEELKLPGKYVVKTMNRSGVESLSRVHGTDPGSPLEAINSYVKVLDGLAAKGFQVPRVVRVKDDGSELWELSREITPFSLPKSPSKGATLEEEEGVAMNLLTNVSKLDSFGFRHNDISPDNIDSTGGLFDWGSASPKSVKSDVRKVAYYEGGYRDKGAAIFVALIILRKIDPKTFGLFDHDDIIENTAKGENLGSLTPALKAALMKMAQEALIEREKG